MNVPEAMEEASVMMVGLNYRKNNAGTNALHIKKEVKIEILGPVAIQCPMCRENGLE
jgi:hypothetical protein